VIAAHHQVAEPSYAIDHFVGTGSVSHNIAEVPNHVADRRSGKNRIKRFEVAMNVGEDKRTHRD
jgi:hypothetical protein